LNYAKWTRTIAFADDLIIAVKAATVAEVENFTNMEMSKITKWSTENKLHFNDQKLHEYGNEQNYKMGHRKQITFQRPKIESYADMKKQKRKAIDVHLNNSHLEQADKYLGIIIESKYKSNEHIKYITDRRTKLINALFKSTRISWGLRHEALKTIYNALY
jgi:hypothetical protein